MAGQGDREYVVTATVRARDRAAAETMKEILHNVIRDQTRDEESYTGVTVEFDADDGSQPWTEALARGVAEDVVRRLVTGELMPAVTPDDVDPRLLEILRETGGRWGALGVAYAAATLTDPVALLARLRGRAESAGKAPE